MRTTWRAVCMLLCVTLVGCGSSSTSGTSSEERAPSNADLDSVVERFGSAFATGDTETLAELIDPNAPDGLISTLEKLAPYRRELEVNDFDYKIVEKTASTARVVYSGQECGPELAIATTAERQDGETTTSEGFVSPSTTLVPPLGPDISRTGKRTCFAIAQTWPPFSFVRIDGKWYGQYKIPDDDWRPH